MRKYHQTESVISDDIFERLKGIPLVNRYEAYQLLSDEWNTVSVDLEIIQTEGFSATKRVDPKLIIKKKDGKDVEVQDGWVGRIVPFALVQDKFFATETAELRDKESRLSEIVSLYEECLDEFTQEEKDLPFINEAGDGFVNAEVTKAAKNKDLDPETREKVKRIASLITEEKGLKKEIKELSGQLVLDTKKRIEELSDEEATDLLETKWTGPITTGLSVIPDRIIGDLASKLDALAKKYEVTFSDIEEEIKETEHSLTDLLSELEGNEEDMLGLEEFKKLLGGN